ncbi:hypothetical protein TELCIR_12985 [Teladorsagia circumcincta]|uniref:Ezrin/radixin/moesin C-terminal domain-containing protein n=1 Tax=Teladorsagia circumcincta TaxID=45464 RepID=A0A2G9U5A4_TELCI|nr:hypothetical protein TELCIR_12985 [Teladorsagia circumcincta]
MPPFRHDFSEKARLFKERLDDFRNEIDAMKREDRQTEHDVIHIHNMHNGFDKFTTLRMSSRGTPKQRVEVFEGL